jgi:hypothetical protein
VRRPSNSGWNLLYSFRVLKALFICCLSWYLQQLRELKSFLFNSDNNWWQHLMVVQVVHWARHLASGVQGPEVHAMFTHQAVGLGDFFSLIL